MIALVGPFFHVVEQQRLLFKLINDIAINKLCIVKYFIKFINLSVEMHLKNNYQSELFDINMECEPLKMCPGKASRFLR